MPEQPGGDAEPWPGLRAGVEAAVRLVDRHCRATGRAGGGWGGAGPPAVMAVDGRSGSGKSTFADALVEALRSRPPGPDGPAEPPGPARPDGPAGPDGPPARPAAAGRGPEQIGRSVTLLRLDDVYPGWHGLAAGVRTVHDAVLPELRRRRRASYPRWDWAADAVRGERAVEAADVVVVEGCGAAAAVAAGEALVVWLDASPDVRRWRALSRDGDTFEPWWETWAAQEVAHADPAAARATADLVVDTEHGTSSVR